MKGNDAHKTSFQQRRKNIMYTTCPQLSFIEANGAKVEKKYKLN